MLSIDSHHSGTYDSPEGQPQGKATDSCVNVNGSLTILLQLGTKVDVYVPTRNKA